jgi:hypothetical protein
MAGDAKATLEIVFDTAQLKTAGTDIKNVGAETTKATTAVTKMGTESKTLGSKVAGVGKQFSGTIASAGALGGTILNLSRQYQDLSDSQIKVDKMQLKVSKTTEATKKAQDALNKMTSAGVKSGAAYEQALLDVKQAMEAQDLAERNLTEAQEDHQRAQENFWIGLVPTVTTAGGTVVSMLKEIGGTKGLGGLKTALTGFGGKASGLLGGLIAGLSGIGSAGSGSVAGINGAAKATTGLGVAMKGTALSMLPVVVAIGGVAVVAKESGIVIHEITSLMKGDLLGAVTSLEDLINLFSTLGSIGGPMAAGFQALSNLKFAGGKSLQDEIKRIKDNLKTIPQAVHEIDPAIQNLDNQTQGVTKTVDSLVGGILGLTQKANAATPALNGTGGAIGGIGTDASTATPGVTGLGTALGVMSNQATMAGVGMALITRDLQPATTGIAGLNAQMNPFNANLSSTAALSKVAASALVTLGQGAQKAAGLALQASQAAAQAAQNMANAASMARLVAQGGVFGHGGGLDFGGGTVTRKGTKGPQFGPMHGNPVQGAANPNFRLKPDWQKAKIIKKKKKAQSGMHEFLNEDTMIWAHKGEEAHIDKPSRMGGQHITISFLPSEFKQFLRYSINEDQGYQK